MAIGIGLGGLAQGRESAARQAMERARLTLSRDELGLKRQQLESTEQARLQKLGQDAVQNTLGFAKDLAKGLNTQIEQGVISPEEAQAKFQQTIGPLANMTLINTKLSGQDPKLLSGQLNAIQAGIGAATPEQQAGQAATTAAATTRATSQVATEFEKPKLTNFFMPDEKRTITIDANDEQSLQKVLERGGVQVSTSIEAASPGQAVGITENETEEFRGAEVATRTALNEITRMRDQIQSGKTLTGLISSGVMGLSAAAGNVLQASRVFGQDDSALLDASKYSLTKFGEAAADSRAFRSNVVNLAYILARAAEPGGRLSDNDVQRQVDRIAGSSGDQRQIVSALNEVERQTIDALKIRHQVLNRGGTLGEFPADLTATEGTFDPETEALIDKYLQ